jgi:hypothetical protein
LTGDVAGGKYSLLLSAILDASEAFGLVWRDQLQFSNTADEVGSDLLGLQLGQWKTDRWPGTRLFGHRALVRIYRADASAAVVLRRPGSLYAWVAPSYPEDLWFMGPGRQLRLVSVAHERDGWLFGKDLASAVGQQITLELEDAELDPALFECPRCR